MVFKKKQSVNPNVCVRTDRQTDRSTVTLIAILRFHTGVEKNNTVKQRIYRAAFNTARAWSRRNVDNTVIILRGGFTCVNRRDIALARGTLDLTESSAHCVHQLQRHRRTSVQVPSTRTS